MLTRLVRIQLIIFTIASVVGLTVMGFAYLQAPTLLGIGRISVKLELPGGGGLYRFSNVTYRGVQIGKVTGVDLQSSGAFAMLSLDASPRVPADLVAEVHSVSAVGEQYVDLLPRTSNPPYLEDGSVIAVEDSAIPKPVGPMLDGIAALMGSIPKDQLTTLIDESSKGLDDAGFDLGSLLDSSATLAGDLRGASQQARNLIDDSGPLLDGGVESADATRIWVRSLAGVSDQLVANDPQIRTLLQNGPGAFGEVTQLLDLIRPTLPVLLANLTSLGKVGVTYNASLEQLLVLVPSFFRGIAAVAPNNNAVGLPLGDFRVGLGDPVACTAGFLPQSEWRSPADQTTIDTPDGLYCKLPQDSPIMVRGLRNLPCMAHPGKRAPTVDICDSDQPYTPLAMRQHVLGPSPIDPNLIAQGIPPDDRVPGEADSRIYGPVEGTPLPPGAQPSGTPPAEPLPAPQRDDEQPLDPAVPPPPDAAVPPPPDAAVSPPPDAGTTPDGVPLPEPAVPPQPTVAPSSFSPRGGEGPSVTVADYDPRSGRYVGTDGLARTQSDLVTDSSSRDWRDLMLTPGA